MRLWTWQKTVCFSIYALIALSKFNSKFSVKINVSCLYAIANSPELISLSLRTGVTIDNKNVLYKIKYNHYTDFVGNFTFLVDPIDYDIKSEWHVYSKKDTYFPLSYIKPKSASHRVRFYGKIDYSKVIF